ncbi:MAG: hypothetical protein AUK48_02375 [Oscillatoriales cyanobacterium CG2_30_44_21]|nr:MAG: hypothetical protein AUK48_02375 [Oscillatoriales cyanobacterium CG2_30_44_21]
MAVDLTFANLNTALGSNAISASGSVLSIDCAQLMGEPSIALTDEKVAELLTNLMDVAADAETAFNANPANTTKLASYPQPVSGVPFIDSTDGNFYVSATYSFASRSPLNKAATTAVNA